jgi:CubicO group peptidase (beta-lactamase class C family)
MINTLINTDFQQTLNAFEVPGASIAVVKNDEVVFANGYGVRELGADQNVDKYTLFAAGSISKSFTSTCLAMLVGEGKIAWDDPVTKYLPDFQLYDAYVTREITIRDLLTHRSGLAEISGGTVWYGSDRDRREVIRRLRYLKPVSSFRSKFAYQNVMYLVAGEIIPAVTGVSWDDFVRERLLVPLNMKSTNTSTNDLSQVSNVASPHSKIDGKVQRVAYRNYDNVGPAASINTSAADLVQYVRFYINSGRTGGQELVESKAFAELTQAQIAMPIAPRPAELVALTPKFNAYGLGWFLRDYRGRKIVLHTGGVDGMTALAGFVPEEELGIVILSNQETPFIGAAFFHILETLLGDPATDWLSAYAAWFQKEEQQKQQQPTPTAISGTSLSLPLSGYAGKFCDTLYGDATVNLEDEHLVLRFEHSSCFTGDLEHWHYDTFRIHWRDPIVPKGFVTFPLDSRGKISEMKFDQPPLLDAEFAELNFVAVADPDVSAAKDID